MSWYLRSDNTVDKHWNIRQFMDTPTVDIDVSKNWVDDNLYKEGECFI